MSVRHFERHVQANVPCVHSGQLTLYRLRDLEGWADKRATPPRPAPKPRRRRSDGGRVPDKATRWPCIVVRHQAGCPARDGKRCRCEPGYMARVWDPVRRRPVHSPTFRSPSEGVTWQQDVRAAFAHGKLIAGRKVTVNEASDQFLDAVKSGTALNKKGKPYKKSTANTIESALRGRIEEELGSLSIDAVRRGQVQTLVDEMVSDGLSGSRIRNVLNALRSLYTYAIARDLAQGSPIANIILPAIGETPRDRVATPREFQELLLALEPADAVPFALAGYATARSQEIFNLIWDDVAWDAGMIYLADQDEYAKSPAAKRPFPLTPTLTRILREECERQTHPAAAQLVCPGRNPTRNESTKLSTSALYKRADSAWDTSKLPHIRLHECRHTASSWLHAAGIDLKTRSVLMGHASTASTDGGRGSITDDRYTHLLPGEIEKAGKQLGAYLKAQTRRG
jgi:integrase